VALRIASRIKPASGFAHFVHLLLVALLPALIYIFIRLKVSQLAVGILILSKWRMFAVRPRYWPANIRANAVDLTVGLSVIVFMAHSNTAAWQLVWAVAYGIWLMFIKPGSSTFMTAMQAMVAQACGLMALFVGWGDASLSILVIGTWLICYVSARHFFTSFEEPYTSLLAHLWGYFAAALVWILGHWLLFYGIVAQPTLLLTVLGYGLATLYYLDQHDRLSLLLRRQFVFIMIAVIFIVLVFSDWGDKAL
jgi:hypothetical protein